MSCSGGGQRQPVCVAVGADLAMNVAVVNVDGIPQDLTGATVYFTLKLVPQDTTVVLAKNTGVGGQGAILSPATDGRAQIFILAADTAALAPQTYVYDIWVKLASGKRYQVVPPSDFAVEQNISVVP